MRRPPIPRTGGGRAAAQRPQPVGRRIRPSASQVGGCLLPPGLAPAVQASSSAHPQGGFLSTGALPEKHLRGAPFKALRRLLDGDWTRKGRAGKIVPPSAE